MSEPLRGSAEANRDTKGSDVAGAAVVVVAGGEGGLEMEHLILRAWLGLVRV